MFAPRARDYEGEAVRLLTLSIVFWVFFRLTEPAHSMANPACWVKEYAQMNYIAKGDTKGEINITLYVCMSGKMPLREQPTAK